jgi:uncharacterized protein (TIGR00304 family)
MPLKMQNLIGIGILLIVIGFIIVFFGILSGSKDSKTKVAVGGFIGPVPFGFGNDKNMVLFAVILSIVIFLIWLLFSLKTKGL